MDFKDTIDRIEQTPKFKDFIQANPHYYLVHAFSVKDDNNSGTWQIGYYSKDTDKIIVFEDDGALISMHDPVEALKNDEYIRKLEIDSLNVSMAQAALICEEVMKQHYPKEIASKQIFLLQNLTEFGNVWNITTVTLAFSVINMKIDAADGKLVKHHKENLMNWRSNPE